VLESTSRHDKDKPVTASYKMDADQANDFLISLDSTQWWQLLSTAAKVSQPTIDAVTIKRGSFTRSFTMKGGCSRSKESICLQQNVTGLIRRTREELSNTDVPMRGKRR
jgi:hypothetical protein